jgi:predicted nucleic acid-binding protein
MDQPGPAMKCVIDASIVASLVLPDELSQKVSAFANRLAEDGALAPGLLQIEIVNVLLVAQRRKRINQSQLGRLLEYVDQLAIALEPSLRIDQRRDLIQLSLKHNLSAYDAAYLELSLRLGLPLASLDHSLLKAAAAEGVKSAL